MATETPRITTAQVDQSLKNARERSRNASSELQDSSQDVVRLSQQSSRSPEVDNTQNESLRFTTASTHRSKLKSGKVWRLRLLVLRTEHDDT
jgi:hypothetical protein